MGIPAPAADNAIIAPHHRRRALADRLVRAGVGVGGVSVIGALLLILCYLLYIAFPLFLPASARPVAAYPVPGGGATLHLALEEQGEQAVRYTDDGRVVFFATASGALLRQVPLLPAGATVAAVATDRPGRGLSAVGLSDGRVLLVEHTFEVSFPGDVRTLTPGVRYPYGREPLPLLEGGNLVRLALREADEGLLFLALDRQEHLHRVWFARDAAGALAARPDHLDLGPAAIPPDFLLPGPDPRRFYVASRKGRLLHYELTAPGRPELVEQVALTLAGVPLTALGLLNGGSSLLAGGADGSITQWFPVRGADNSPSLRLIRGFTGQHSAVTAIAAEERRKGFLAADAAGQIGVYHATAHRTLLVAPVAEAGIGALAVSPRADTLLALDTAGRAHLWRLRNEHPEVSFSALWGKVHYEGYSEPRYIWQSSAAGNDFEPKLSLVPPAFGTLKAALYAMAVAVPLAVLGAIYTAYFMAPAMRRVVKPTIEVMEALPTVILGFLAGLWLAPYVEAHLPGVLAMVVVIPLGILAFGYGWQRLPGRLRWRVHGGWEALLLLPVVTLLIGLSLALSAPLEQVLFGGDIRGALAQHLGLGFDQRNALVVGLALGFAVIPTIFSIAEDAIFSVPRHLVHGSLALGATAWQTLVRVVILTASPGIFSAVMIGMGRAVGETMIVLMASGNTPILDLNVFEGMRTLAAGIAVELPESEVGSTHYRVLFLAALLLFLFTFAVNTVAEVVRQRLRRRYSSL